MRARTSLLLPVLLAVGACGTTTVDTDKGEAFIGTTVEKQVGASVESVECPEDVEAKKGDTFECEVTGADGTAGPAKVIQKDDKGNVRVSAAFVHTGNLESLLQRNLAAEAGAQSVRVRCPDIVVGKRGGTFVCTAKAAGAQTTRVKFIQKDAAGNVQVVQ